MLDSFIHTWYDFLTVKISIIKYTLFINRNDKFKLKRFTLYNIFLYLYRMCKLVLKVYFLLSWLYLECFIVELRKIALRAIFRTFFCTKCYFFRQHFYTSMVIGVLYFLLSFSDSIYFAHIMYRVLYT